MRSIKAKKLILSIVATLLLIFPTVIWAMMQITQEKSTSQEILSSRELERAAAVVYKNAVRDFAKGRYWKAARDLVIVLNSYPEFSNIDGVVYYLGECLYEMEMLKAAERLFKYLLAQNVTSSFVPKTLYGLERVKYKSQQYAEALDYFQKLQRGFPKAEIAQGPIYYAGQSYFHLKEYEKAIQILDSINERSDYYGFALYTMGLCHIKKKSSPKLLKSSKS